MKSLRRTLSCLSLTLTLVTLGLSACDRTIIDSGAPHSETWHPKLHKTEFDPAEATPKALNKLQLTSKAPATSKTSPVHTNKPIHPITDDLIKDKATLLRRVDTHLVRATVPNLRPYHVALATADKQAFCSGALIARQWIITAAQCVAKHEAKHIHALLGTNQRQPEKPNPFYNLFGPDTKQQGQRISIKRVVLHPHYNQKTQTHNLAVLELEHSIDQSKQAKSQAKPIALIGQGYSSPPYLQPSLQTSLQKSYLDHPPIHQYGWISTSWNLKNKQTRFLQETEHVQQSCLNLNTANHFSDTVKAARKPSKDLLCTKTLWAKNTEVQRPPQLKPCTDELGSPLISSYDGQLFLLGIMSKPDPTCMNRKHVYTRASNYLPWIHSVTGVSAASFEAHPPPLPILVSKKGELKPYSIKILEPQRRLSGRMSTTFKATPKGSIALLLQKKNASGGWNIVHGSWGNEATPAVSIDYTGDPSYYRWILYTFRGGSYHMNSYMGADW